MQRSHDYGSYSAILSAFSSSRRFRVSADTEHTSKKKGHEINVLFLRRSTQLSYSPVEVGETGVEPATYGSITM